MLQTLKLFGLAIRKWWKEFLFLLALNFLWLLAQMTVILGPPSTVALYIVTQHVLDGSIVDFGDFWRAIKGNFVNSWIWGRCILSRAALRMDLFGANVVYHQFILLASLPGSS